MGANGGQVSMVCHSSAVNRMAIQHQQSQNKGFQMQLQPEFMTQMPKQPWYVSAGYSFVSWNGARFSCFRNAAATKQSTWFGNGQVNRAKVAAGWA